MDDLERLQIDYDEVLNKCYAQWRKDLCREFDISLSDLNKSDLVLSNKLKYQKHLVNTELDFLYEAFMKCAVINNGTFINFMRNLHINTYGEYKRNRNQVGFVKDQAIYNEILTSPNLYHDLKLINKINTYERLNKSVEFLSSQEIDALKKKAVELGKNYLIQAKHLIDANRSILSRCRKRLKAMKNSDCYVLFMTLTNSDKYFERSTYEGRLQYARRLLKKYACDYVLNTDYGKENGREHFHSVACFKTRQDYKAFSEAYIKHTDSAIFNKHFGKNDSDCFKSAKYISCLTIEKLAFHSVKESTKRTRLIYCSHPDFNKSISVVA